MSHVTELSSGRLTTTDTITIELAEASKPGRDHLEPHS